MSLQTRLFVGNIPEYLTDVDLREAFSTYGAIVNLELKNKPGVENEKKRFAFITLAASNYNIESCIKDIPSQEFQGQRLYVTRARESFLERLQREREQARQLDEKKNWHSDHVSEEKPIINLSVNLNPQKRKNDISYDSNEDKYQQKLTLKNVQSIKTESQHPKNTFCENNENFGGNVKKLNSEQKRLESLKRKRQEFKEKNMIIKTGLIAIDKVSNKKVIFSDNEENCEMPSCMKNNAGENITNNEFNSNKSLFDDEDSDTEVNFEIKKQFEGENGQKVLDLQSRYKSDKRFKLDERFIEDSLDHEKEDKNINEGDGIDVGQSDEKYKQMTILQDVLGVSIKMSNSDSVDRKKSKLGMLRYDPMHPDHQKFLAPVENLSVTTKKGKKKKSKDVPEEPTVPEIVVEKVEASKEQFYKVSDTLKEAMAQPNTFSLRNLFANEDNDDKEQEQSPQYVEVPKQKEKKTKNQLDTSGKNPFVYDSSDTEDEDEDKKLSNQDINGEEKAASKNSEIKAVWRENLFFSPNDNRLTEGLLFFNKFEDGERQKERRGLKTIMKKRIYNKERKNHLFQKKIGGRKKTMKKSTTKRR